MSKQPTEERVEQVVCDCCSTVPISQLDLDLGTPMAGWPTSLEGRGIEIVTDDLGRRAIKREDFAELVAERNERERQLLEERRRRDEKAAQRKTLIPAGAPAVDGMTPPEAMIDADPNYKTPYEEFSGRERPTFLEDMLAEGQRDLAEKQAKAKQRAVDQMKKDLQ